MSRDPLKIRYLIVHHDIPMEEMSPFQGFSPAWWEVGWALRVIARLPADVVERYAPIDPLIRQRIGGARAVEWIPVLIDALETQPTSSFSLFNVAFTGTRETAERLESWRRAKRVDLLHVSSVENAGGISPDCATAAGVIDHCRSVFAERADELDSTRRTTAADAFAAWQPLEPEPLAVTKWGHNTLTPNQLALERAGRRLDPGEPFIGRTEEEYDQRILECARAVLAVRERAGLGEFNRISLISPEVYLVEPALYRGVYPRTRLPKPHDSSAVPHRVLRTLQSQRGFLSEIKQEFLEGLADSSLAQALLATRQRELAIFTDGVGLAAAQTASAVIRLSPAINHTFPALASFARSIRSHRPEHRLKQPRLFANIQRQLAEALGSRRLGFVRDEVSGPLKIISDAPVEWLQVGKLPLMMRFQTSRLNATPGNLLMGELSRNTVITLHPDQLRDVLVISAFRPDDPLRDHLRNAIELLRPSWEGKVKVAYVQAQKVDDLVHALHRFQGSILIFDGHGYPASPEGDGIGRLMVGDKALDVWQLRGQVRVPPIVILSACDTLSVDGPSHATVGNGMLAIGAMAVIATLLPVGGGSSAGFIARLVFRLANFIPALLSWGFRVTSWAEVVWGMQRMLLASELLDELIGPPDVEGTPRHVMQTKANVAIHSSPQPDDWYLELIEAAAEHRREPITTVEDRAMRVIARSEAIRYVQLGHPENILTDDGTIREAIVPEHLRHLGRTS